MKSFSNPTHYRNPSALRQYGRRLAMLSIMLFVFVAVARAQNISGVDNMSQLKSMAREAYLADDSQRLKAVINRMEQVEPGSSAARHYQRLMELPESQEENNAPQNERTVPESRAPYFTPIPTPELRQDFSQLKQREPASAGMDLPVKQIAIYGGSALGGLVVLLLLLKFIKGRKQPTELDVALDEGSKTFDMTAEEPVQSGPQVAGQLTPGDFDSMPDTEASQQEGQSVQHEPVVEVESEDNSVPLAFSFDSGSSDDQAAEDMQSSAAQEAPETPVNDEDVAPAAPPSDLQDLHFSLSDEESEDTVVAAAPEEEDEEIITFDLGDEIPEAGLSAAVDDPSEAETMISSAEQAETEETPDTPEGSESPVFDFEESGEGVASEEEEEPVLPDPEELTFELGEDLNQKEGASQPVAPQASAPVMEISDDAPLVSFDLNEAETLLDIGSSEAMQSANEP
ncbi:MAG: hypothetical protein ACOC2L_02255, partial [Candidatus Sumerlaeota bacterium]